MRGLGTKHPAIAYLSWSHSNAAFVAGLPNPPLAPPSPLPRCFGVFTTPSLALK